MCCDSASPKTEETVFRCLGVTKDMADELSIMVICLLNCKFQNVALRAF